MKYKYVIWDLDGTLLNTIEDLHASVNYALEKYGQPIKTLKETTRNVGNGIRLLISRSLEGGEENPVIEEVFSAFKAHYAENCLNLTRPYDKIPELLQTLKASGVKMAVVSNKIDFAVKDLRDRFFPWLDVAMGEQSGIARKPDPAMVYLAMEELGATAAETVFIGDSEVDVVTARNAGLDCIAVLWGFREKEELEAVGGKTFAENADELAALLGLLKDRKMARYKYRYETHVHTCEVSKCGRSTVEEQVRFYADLGYDGMFITDHFMRGNCTIPRDLPWEEQVDLYCASYEKGAELGKQYGIKVFFGLEVSFGGCDLIVLGLGKEWLKAHPEVMTVSQEDFCVLVRQSGGFIVHAHPFREAAYIMMSSVIPDKEDAVEIYNPNCDETANELAKIYAREYGLPMTAGSDNHSFRWQRKLYGFETKEPLDSVHDYINALKNGLGRPFRAYREVEQ